MISITREPHSMQYCAITTANYPAHNIGGIPHIRSGPKY